MHPIFDKIAAKYDPINRILSLGQDQRWRREVARFVPNEPFDLLDLAAGTGDQIIALLEANAQVRKAIGLDLSEPMLEIGRQKCAQKGYSASLQQGDAQQLPFPDCSFDICTISFGIRNVEQPILALREMHRVLRPGGRCLILEFSIPENRLIRPLYLFYLRSLLPRIGGWISKNPSAYRYLNRTIETFPSGQAFCDLLRAASFIQIKHHSMNFGGVSLYEASRAYC